MQRNLTIKTVVIVATVLICIFGIIGLPTSVAKLQSNIAHNIHLGLDLKGGSHLVLQVQVQDAAKAEADQVIELLREETRTRNILVAGGFDRNDPETLKDTENIQVTLHGVDPAKASILRSMVTEKFPDWTLSGLNANDYKMNMKPSSVLELKRNTVTQSLQTIEKRVNELGLTEPTVQAHGDPVTQSEILVELPGEGDPAHVKEIIGATAQLKIVEVKNEGPWKTAQEALGAKGGILPLNTELREFVSAGASGGWYLISRTPVITGQDMRSAKAATDPDSPGRWETSFTLSQDGARRFERFTQANIGNRLAVVLDTQIRSVATIQSAISDSGRINGLSSDQEANDLALVLRTGALPAGIKYLQDATVGPSLGLDSIREGIFSGIAGLVAVIIVMLIYYKKAGLNAVLALLLNTILLMAALCYFGATLTLPGIAGIILTVGMAVDSNVLIFERIREEIRSGKSIIAAVDAGFGKAWWTIVDTHVTTIVSCLFLFIFGSGPVKGFAVTLVIGLLANVFTAVFVSKVIFDWELSGKTEVTELSI